MADRSSPSSVETEAANWVARLHAGAPEAGDLQAFETWLAASQSHVTVYNRAEAMWLSLDQDKTALLDALEPEPAPVPRAGPKRFRRVLAGGITAMGLLAAAVVLSPMLNPPSRTFETASGETRLVRLADGSVMRLNTATRIEVSITARKRAVRLEEGEAVFEVAHDAARPFSVAIGDQIVRDVGTEFDLLSHDGRMALAVRSGVVEVSGRDSKQSVRVEAGEAISKVSGDAWVSAASPAEDAFSWTKGYLVYRQAPMAQVAADIRRYSTVPVTADASTGDLRFSGVLQIESPEVMLRNLEALAPVKADRREHGVTLRAQ